jgi:hypothetical protein
MLNPKSRFPSFLLTVALLTTAVAAVPGRSVATDSEQRPMLAESLVGDVYEPVRWRELRMGTFFTEGWTEAWAGGPNGDGGAPRQGWLNAQDGVFYRLGLFTGNWATDVSNADAYAGGLTWLITGDLVPYVSANLTYPTDSDFDETVTITPGFDEFFGNLYHLNAEEEPENEDYPKNPEFRKKFGPRGVIKSSADGKIDDTGPLTKKRMETMDGEVLAATTDFILCRSDSTACGRLPQ